MSSILTSAASFAGEGFLQARPSQRSWDLPISDREDTPRTPMAGPLPLEPRAASLPESLRPSPAAAPGAAAASLRPSATDAPRPRLEVESAPPLRPAAPFSRDISDYPDGIVLPIDKPYRWTSADVVRKVKYAACRHFGKKNLKVGHAGTLDPLATGILLVCIGNATKRAEELQRSPKQYLAGVSFGATTPSYDLEKEIDRVFPLDGVTEDSVRALLPSFVGEQMQVAPLFSAKSVDGVRAYETARRLLRESQRTGRPFVDDAGILQSSLVNIYGLELVSFTALADAQPSGDLQLATTFCDSRCAPSSRSRIRSAAIPAGCTPESGQFSTKAASAAAPSKGSDATDRGAGEAEPSRLPLEGADRRSRVEKQSGCAATSARIHVADVSGYELATAMIRVDCSKGTYIRALARDLGEALGSGAFLSSLRRTCNGGFDISQAITLEEAVSLFADR